MDDQQAELEMHLAAGTGLPTALAAMGDDPKPQRSKSGYGAAIFAVVIFVLVFWLLSK